MFARLRSSRGAGLIGELLMLVIGINIALWFEGKFEDYKDAESEQQYLQGLHNDLRVDVDSLERRIRYNQDKIEKLTALVPELPDLADAPAEKQALTVFEPPSYDFFEPSDFTFRSMQESGDFRLISDDELKTGLLRLARRYRQIERLQENFIQALDAEYIPLMMRSFNIAEMRLDQPDLIDNLVFRNFFAFAIQDTSQRVATLEDARDQAQTLLDRIGDQLRDRTEAKDQSKR
jgi:hypothetical protein